MSEQWRKELRVWLNGYILSIDNQKNINEGYLQGRKDENKVREEEIERLKEGMKFSLNEIGRQVGVEEDCHCPLCKSVEDAVSLWKEAR